MTATKGFRASARPPSAIRTPLFAPHSRQDTTQKSVNSEPYKVLKLMTPSPRPRQNTRSMVDFWFSGDFQGKRILLSCTT